MKKLRFALCMLALLAFGCDSKTEVEVGFKTTMKLQSTYDAGKVAIGEVINATFEVENTGDGALILSDVKGTCGCTVADWTKDPIPPGEKGMIKAQVNTEGFSTGPVKKTITVMANTTPSVTTIMVKANIIK